MIWKYFCKYKIKSESTFKKMISFIYIVHSTCASQACCTSAFWHFVILDRTAMSSTSSRATPTPERVNSVTWSTDKEEEKSLYCSFYHDSFGVTGFVLSRTYWCCVSHMDCPPVLCRSVPAAGGLRTSAAPGRTRMSSLFYVSRPRMLRQEMGKGTCIQTTHSAVSHDILTDDGTALCTVEMISADFHPTVEIHL